MYAQTLSVTEVEMRIVVVDHKLFRRVCFRDSAHVTAVEVRAHDGSVILRGHAAHVRPEYLACRRGDVDAVGHGQVRDQRAQVGAVGGGGQHLPGHGGLRDVGNVAAHADVEEVEGWGFGHGLEELGFGTCG